MTMTNFKLSQSQPGPFIHPSGHSFSLLSLFSFPLSSPSSYIRFLIFILPGQSSVVFASSATQKFRTGTRPWVTFLMTKHLHMYFHLPEAKRSGPPASKAGDFRKVKQVKSSDGSPWLDDVTLGELEPEQSPQESWRQKTAWIQTWAKRVPWDAMEENH